MHRLQYLPAFIHDVLLYNVISYVSAYNQDTPVTIFAYKHPSLEWFCFSSNVVNEEMTNVWSWNHLSNEAEWSHVQYVSHGQRPVLYRFICNQKLDYINVIQRIQITFNHHVGNIIDFTFYKDDFLFMI